MLWVDFEAVKKLGKTATHSPSSLLDWLFSIISRCYLDQQHFPLPSILCLSQREQMSVNTCLRCRFDLSFLLLPLCPSITCLFATVVLSMEREDLVPSVQEFRTSYERADK